MNDDERELIAEVSRDLVAEVAPEEMVLFKPLSAAYFDSAHRLPQASKDDMLGFGAGEVVVALTPVALSVVSEVLVTLRKEIAETAAKRTVGTADQGLRGLFRRFHRTPEAASTTPAPAAGLTKEQLAEVGRVAYEKARAMRMSEERARLLADAMVGSLVQAG